MSEVNQKRGNGNPRRLGATERLLERAKGGDHTPYEWLQRAVAPGADRVVDLMCGTGTLAVRLVREGRTVVGVSDNYDELHIAQQRGPATWVQSKLGNLPFPDASVAVVVSSLGLGLVNDRKKLLAEIARVLRPGGVFAGLSPSIRPLSIQDLPVSSKVAAMLRKAPKVPGSSEFRAKKALAEVGMTKMEDARARYQFQVTDLNDAEMLLAGLRHDLKMEREEAVVESLASRAAESPYTVPLQMRRIVAIK